MKEQIEDLYIDCNDLIKEANELYLEVINAAEGERSSITDDDKEYLDCMNKYINNYTKYRKKLINDYINDLKKMIND
jgi:hypothetical protein